MTEYSARTLLELTVGDGNASIECLINLRKCDLHWWNSNIEYNEQQLYKLISLEVLPVECSYEIDRFDEGKRPKIKRDGNKGKIIIGEKNTLSNATNKKKKNNDRGKNAGKGKNNIDTAPVNKGKDRQQKSNSEIRYLFGESIQITYKIEEISTSKCATLVFNVEGDNHDDDTSTVSELNENRSRKRKQNSKCERDQFMESNITFTQLRKIPKRLVIWCFPFDPKKPMEPYPCDGGFPRPEFIPITSLFKNDDTDGR